MTTPLVRRLPRILAMAIVLGYFGYAVFFRFLIWNPADAGAYYDAAVRLTRGQPLYPLMSPDAYEVYRYAPWFAAVWIPLTALPRDVVLHVWSVAMLACSLAAVWPLLSRPTWARVALAAIAGQALAETAMFGNVHPLVVAILVWTAGRRSFPAWVGVAASIKLVPLGFVLVWVLRREWAKAGIALAVTLLLVAPMLLFDLSHYVTNPGSGLESLYSISPPLWETTALASLSATVWLSGRGSPYAWVAAAVLMFLGPPRVVLSYVSFILVAYELTQRDLTQTSTRRCVRESPR